MSRPIHTALPLFLLLVSAIGILDAAYLCYAHLFGTAVCGAASGCGTVMASPWSAPYGIPLSALGLGLYLAIACASWRALRGTAIQRIESLRWISLLALFAAVPTLVLIYLQGAVIHAWCPFCLLSAALVFIILSISWWARARSASLRPLVGPLRSPDLVPLALAVVLPALVFLPLKRGLERRHPAPSAAAASSSAVTARIGAREITAAEMDRGIAVKLYQQRNTLREEWLERQLIAAEAAERGVAVAVLLHQEVTLKVAVTPEEIDRRYAEVADKLPDGVTKQSVARSIGNELLKGKSETRRAAFIAALREKFGTRYTVPRAERFAVDPNPRGGPELGPPDAPVTVVIFSDLGCGFCAMAHATLRELLARRGDELRLVFKHLPLEKIHPHSKRTGEVAAAAHAQGKFWELADLLYEGHNFLKTDQVMTFADQIGLDLQKLNADLASGSPRQQVEADLAEARSYGLVATPTILINGHPIGSIHPDGIEPLIDRELALIADE